MQTGCACATKTEKDRIELSKKMQFKISGDPKAVEQISTEIEKILNNEFIKN